MSNESKKMNGQLDKPFNDETKKNKAVERELRAQKKAKREEGGGGGEQPLLPQTNPELDASHEHAYNALLGPRINSGGGGGGGGDGGGGGGGGESQSVSDEKNALTMAVAAEEAAQPNVTKHPEKQMDSKHEDMTSDEAVAKQQEEAKQERQKLRKQRLEEREAFDRQGVTDYEKLKQLLPGGIPQALFKGKKEGLDEVHPISIKFIVEPVKSPSYKCNKKGHWCWVVQNDEGETWTNGVIVRFKSIQPQHAVVTFDPLEDVWYICPASGDDNCTVTVNDTAVHFDNPKIIVKGDKIVLGNIHLVFTTEIHGKK